jgi:hypothetical protein
MNPQYLELPSSGGSNLRVTAGTIPACFREYRTEERPAKPSGAGLDIAFYLFYILTH